MDIHHIQNMIADIERQEEKMREFEREISLAKTAVRNIATPVLQTAGWKPMWVEMTVRLRTKSATISIQTLWFPI